MGTDKALLRVAPDRSPLLQSIVERVSPIAAEMIVVAPRDRGYDRFGIPVIPDLVPGCGPLGGIVTALDAARFDRCLVLSCDLPALRPEVISWMVSQPFAGDALVPKIAMAHGNRVQPQPLHAIYRRRCLSIARRRLERGELRLSALLDDLDVRWLTPDEIRTIDPDFRSFFNLNQPEDLEQAERLMAEKPEVDAMPPADLGR